MKSPVIILIAITVAVLALVWFTRVSANYICCEQYSDEPECNPINPPPPPPPPPVPPQPPEPTPPPPSPELAPQPPLSAPQSESGSSRASGRNQNLCEWPQYYASEECQDGIWDMDLNALRKRYIALLEEYILLLQKMLNPSTPLFLKG